MVEGNLVRKIDFLETEGLDYTYLPNPLKHTSVSLSDVFSNKLRLEANAFNLEAMAEKEKVKNNKFGFVNLWSEDGLVSHAFYPGRFKRIYVSKKDGKPFFLPSQLTEVKPKATKYISPKTYKSLTGIIIEPNNLLMTRSGTIGKCTISSKTNIGQLYSDDVIRVTFKNHVDLGYTYAYLQTRTGQTILQTNNYGAVVKHIEPEHLENIIIPNAPQELKEAIHKLVVESFDLRDKSNELIDKAEIILYKELQLEALEDLKVEYLDNSVGVRNYTTKLSKLNLRLDASYHIPICDRIINHLKMNCKEIKYLRNDDVSDSIILPSRFKRTYVAIKEHGIKFIGGKQINDLNPSSNKYLSKIIHKSRLEKELALKENCILITRSGTIGKVSLVPKHWENWAANDHIIRVFPSNNNIAGFLYCWLNSEYGLQLIRQHTYGSVVDEIDTNHVGDVPLPIFNNQTKQQEINNLVLKANDLRYKAYLKEQEAIKKMEEIINTTN
ncbi:restriction endonuclease subunit S [Aureispira sp. CCB-QB1]|uniref:restriction endonuclease subunit S n=1 Tax=Aureispira sp. CCB-QB1 TaxID=1313421 RepID=UPI000695B2E3|nr:restriction endonuclease subunit S [Aureispira sp. CCB-QB1]